MKRIRVLFVLPALVAGGAERVLISIMNGLDRERFEPVFLTVSDEGPMREFIDSDVAFHTLHMKKLSIASVPKLYNKIKAVNPDIIVSTMVHMNFCVLLLRWFFPRTRFIVREAITPSFIFEAHPRLKPFLKMVYKALYPQADAVLSPAQAIIDEFKILPGMVCENHLLLPNPVDVDKIRERAEEWPSEILTRQGRDDTVYFVASGRLHPQKGFDRLIEVLSGLQLPYDWRLHILGEGSERKDLEDLIQKKGLQDQVVLIGLKANPWPYYAAADCFLLPSRWEGLPNVILEALACGTPVIAHSEAGGIAEIAQVSREGSVTLVHDMQEFLQAMDCVQPNYGALSQPPLRPSLLPERFHSKKVVEKLEAVLVSVSSSVKVVE